MLVLQRRIDEAIKIGDEVEVVVLAISGDHVKLGIQAPRHIRVLRSELMADLQEENRRAAAAAQNAGAPNTLGNVLGEMLGHLPEPPRP